MKPNFIIFLLIFLVNFKSGIAQEDNIKFEYITSEHGLSQNIITCLIQDSTGYIWVGTADGLNKYDSYKFETYKNELDNDNSLSSSRINALMQDNEGYIWVATRNGLNRFNQKTKKIKRFFHDENNKNSISNNWVYSIIQDNKGYIWIGTRKGLNKFDKKTQTFKHYFHDKNNKNSLPYDIIITIFQDHNGLLWIGTHNKGLIAFDPKTEKFKHYFSEETKEEHNLSSNFIRVIYEDRDYNLWVGTERGIFKMKNKVEPSGYFTDYQSGKFKYEFNVNSILQDRKGNIWVGTWGLGANRYIAEKDTFINYIRDKSAMTTSKIYCIMAILEDKFGILWMGSWNLGLNKYDPEKEKFTAYRPSEKPEYEVMNTVTSMFEDQEKNLWIGTGSKGLTSFNRETGKIINYKYEKNNPYTIQDSQSAVYAICKDSSQNLWIGTRHGLQKIDKKTRKFIVYAPNDKNPHSLNNHVVRSLYVKSGILWVGTDNGLHRLIITETENKKSPENVKFDIFLNNPKDTTTISDNRIRKITEDQDGNLWIGTAKGLNKLDLKTEKFTQFINNPKNPNSLNQNYVWSVCVDENNIVWIGTNGGGLNKYNQKTKTFTFYTEKNGLANNGIWGVLQDRNQKIWLSTNKGLSVFNIKTETFKNYNIKDGLQSNQFNGGSYFLNEKTGEMFFGGTNGFNTFFPEKIKDNPYKAPVIINNFQILNEDVSVGENSILKQSIEFTDFIELTHEDYIFSFEFLYLHFSSPRSNRYKYMLENFNDDWIYVSAERRFATYTNIAPGDYVFKVMASNGDGVWSDKVASLKIRILPPFWNTLWFKILAVFVVSGGTFLWYRTRINRIQRQKIILEQQVEERTTEIRKQNDEILLKNKEISNKNAHIKASIRYASVIQKAALPFTDVLKKYIEDYFIIYRPRDLVSGDFYWINEYNNKLYVVAADCTGHGVPGGFLSMLGISFLNEIINTMNLNNISYNAGKILDLIRQRMIKSLRSSKSYHGNDGMDLALIVIDKKSMTLNYSGAYNSIYFANDLEIKKIKADRMPIGHYPRELPFKNHYLTIKKDDIIYLMSDGYIDQLGYINYRKFSRKRLTGLISNVKQYSMKKQHKLFVKSFDDWKGHLEQIDDVLLMALKI